LVAVTSAEGRQTARLFWVVILPSYTPLQAQECDGFTQHENDGGLSGRWVDDVLCGNPPYFASLYSSKSGIGPELRDIAANGVASRSF
jgi:hypothetical protein